MGLSAEDINLIEKFVRGQLNSTEKLHFEERMEDLSFRKEVTFYQSVQNAQTDLGRSRLKESFKTWDKETSESGRKRLFLDSRWSMAAGFILLILGGIYLVWPKQQTNLNDLFQAHYETYPNLIDPIEKGDPSDDGTNSQFFELRDYRTAALTSPKDSLQEFYQGLAYLEVNQLDKAIASLIPISRDARHRFHQASQWYLGLAYLRQGDIENARAALKLVSGQGDHDHRMDANNLLQRLDQ